MTIRTAVFPVGSLPADLQSQLDACSRVAFPLIGADDGLDADGRQWSAGEWHVLAWDGDQWGSAVDILKRQITVGDRPVLVGGVGGVMTSPPMRGRGLARAAMRHTADFICAELRADIGMLFCLPGLVSFYSDLGWHELERRITYTQAGKNDVLDTRARQDGCAMFRPCGDFIMPHGAINIHGLLW